MEGKKNRKELYGGYYKQEDVEEIIAHAKSKFVTIIPEIEMPGHASAAIAAYPGLSCTDEHIQVETRWGVIHNVYCAGNDDVYTFLENVLSEIMTLFTQSKYIHIGGDECPKDKWKSCAKCQQKMKEQGLSNEDQLQHYFMNRINQFLMENGYTLIGWDEILEGDTLPLGVIVQSWRGMEGAKSAIEQGHQTIVSPTSHCYFDYPITTTDIKQVYSFEPGMDVLGGECCCWSEHMNDESRVDYMAFPRILAMSEVLWTKDRSFSDFCTRLQTHFDIMDSLEINYGPADQPIVYDTTFVDNRLHVTLSQNNIIPLQIYYTIDGSAPDDKHNHGNLNENVKIVIDKFKQKVSAQAYRNNKLYGNVISTIFTNNKCTGKHCTFMNSPSEKYGGKGMNTLCNGVRASTNVKDKEWLGFFDVDMQVVVDLEQETHFTRIGLGCLQHAEMWIQFPKQVEFLVSTNGTDYISVGIISSCILPVKGGAILDTLEYRMGAGLSVRYIKIVAQNSNKKWIFVDQIIVD
jgi:hexosaminidase